MLDWTTHEYVRQMWGGPGHLRFYLQPLMAIALACRDGVHDARDGRPPYLFSLFTDPAVRKNFTGALIKRLAFPLSLALAMDVCFQLVVRGTWRPGATLVYAAIFVALPYTLARGLANRVSGLLLRRSPRRSAEA